jgi:hypothetical protein
MKRALFLTLIVAQSTSYGMEHSQAMRLLEFAEKNVTSGAPELIQDIVRSLKYSPDAKKILQAKNSDGDTALIIAARNGNLALVTALLKWRVDMSLNKGMTPLTEAARNGHFDVVNVLINDGARVKDYQQEDPIRLARENGFPALANYLQAIVRPRNLILDREGRIRDGSFVPRESYVFEEYRHISPEIAKQPWSLPYDYYYWNPEGLKKLWEAAHEEQKETYMTPEERKEMREKQEAKRLRGHLELYPEAESIQALTALQREGKKQQAEKQQGEMFLAEGLKKLQESTQGRLSFGRLSTGK